MPQALRICTMQDNAMRVDGQVLKLQLTLP
jgi:hypothetical protein